MRKSFQDERLSRFDRQDLAASVPVDADGDQHRLARHHAAFPHLLVARARLSEPAHGDLRKDGLFEHVLRHGHHHFGRDVAGADRVDRDALIGVFLSQSFGEAEIARLGRGIVDLAHLAFLAVDRRDVDDAAEAALAHAVDDGSGHVEERVEVRVDDGVPLFRGHFVEHAVFGDAGVVDQNVHRAEVLRDLRQSGRAGLEAADVPLVGLHAGFGLELRRRFVISVIGRRDLVSSGLQRFGNRRADAARAASDHYNSAHVSSLRKDVGAGTIPVPRARRGDRA